MRAASARAARLKRRTVLLALGAVGVAGAEAITQPVPSVAYGSVQRWERYVSQHVDARHVDIWLPPDYANRAAQGERFAVVYLHDGQMLFDARTTWNGQSWALDQAVQRAGVDCILVGVWNNGKLRHSEYYPAGFLRHLQPELRQRFTEQALLGRSRSDAYLRCLVEEIKPAVDARYATLPAREHTFLMGSSMGGLISLYGLCEYPTVFGGAACLSTHWIATFERNQPFPDAALAYLAEHVPTPGTVRLWTDRGTEQLDALYDQAHDRVGTFLRSKGYRPPHGEVREYPGTGHNEAAWAARAHEALRLLLSA